MITREIQPFKADILVVDDTLDNLRLISSMLSSNGYKVRKAINGQQALNGARILKPDLILLDINMPVMNGYEVCENLKSVEITKDIPVIFISALDEPIDKVRAFNVGGADYITKPFHFEEVLARVQNQLSIHQLQKNLQEQNEQLQIQILKHEQAEQEIIFLLKTTQLINESFDLNSALEITMSEVCQMIGWDLAEVWIPRADGSSLEYNQSWYCDQENFHHFLENSKKLQFPLGVGLPGKVWSSKEVRWIENLAEELPEDFCRTEIAAKEELKSALGIPIWGKNQILAIIVFFKKIASKPDRHIIDLVNAVATQLGSQIYRKKIEAELIKLNQELEILAISDSLTGIANRRKFNEYFYKQWLQMLRWRLPLSLIMCDVDYFKKYNDTYGHLAGDFCLRQIATAIQECVNNPEYLVARYGGEEFGIILSNVNMREGLAIAEIIRQKVENLKIPHSQSNINPFVTLSLGLATIIPDTNIDPEKLIFIADQVLYDAKQQGRNCVAMKEINFD